MKCGIFKCKYDRAKHLTTKPSAVSEEKKNLSSVLISDGYPSSLEQKTRKDNHSSEKVGKGRKISKSRSRSPASSKKKKSSKGLWDSHESPHSSTSRERRPSSRSRLKSRSVSRDRSKWHEPYKEKDLSSNA